MFSNHFTGCEDQTAIFVTQSFEPGDIVSGLAIFRTKFPSQANCGFPYLRFLKQFNMKQTAHFDA